jgi:peptidoglycan biosynthesis protein MviN/MurJ (putative lipid II flippase)
MSVVCFEVVSVVFLRGEFHVDEAMEASRFTRVFVFMIPFLLLNTMVARLIMATEKIDKSFGYQSVIGILIGIICMAGIHYFGPHAYPYAVITAYIINLLTVKFLLDRFFPWLKGFYRLPLFGVLIFAVNAAIVPLDLVLKNSVREAAPIGIIAVVSGFHFVIFGITAYFLKVFRPFNDAIETVRLKIQRKDR